MRGQAPKVPANRIGARPLVVEPVRNESDRTKEDSMPTQFWPESIHQDPPGGVGGLQDMPLVVVHEWRLQVGQNRCRRGRCQHAKIPPCGPKESVGGCRI